MTAARQIENSFDVIMSLLVKHCNILLFESTCYIYINSQLYKREGNTAYPLHMKQENKEVNVLILKILKLKTYENQPKHRNLFAIKNPSSM